MAGSTSPGTIKRGVRLYSFQNETFQGKMSPEDCIRTCTEMGARGIEVIGEQTFWGMPKYDVDPAAIENWHALIKKYDCAQASFSATGISRACFFAIACRGNALDDRALIGANVDHDRRIIHALCL
jgi:hypothetical protein